MRNQLLLLEDVEDLGRSGDLVSVKPGFARNFLLPQKKAVIAEKYTLRMQAKLQEERAKRAESDRQEAEGQAKQIEGKVLRIEVKVDPDGHMYGSVAAYRYCPSLRSGRDQARKAQYCACSSYQNSRRTSIPLKLKEGVPARVTLNVVCEGHDPTAEEQEFIPPQE